MYLHIKPWKRVFAMKVILPLSVALALGLLVVGVRSLPAAAGSGSGAPPGAHRAEIEYLEMVNALGPPKDPQLLFLLMAQYSNASLQQQGVEFFAARRKTPHPAAAGWRWSIAPSIEKAAADLSADPERLPFRDIQSPRDEPRAERHYRCPRQQAGTAHQPRAVRVRAQRT